MEYLFRLENDTLLLLYDDGNNVVASFIEKNRNMRKAVLTRDYRYGLGAKLIEDKIYITYVSINDEIVFHKFGNETKLVLLNNVEIVSKVYWLDIVEINNKIYVMYQHILSENNHKIMYIDVMGNRTSNELLVETQNINKIVITQDIVGGVLACFILCGTIKYYLITRKNEFELKSEMVEFCNKKLINDLEQKCVVLEKQYKTYIEELKQKYEDKLENERKYIQNRYIEQYEELEKLAKDIQEEGKKWRDKYYKSIKKNNDDA